MILRLTALGLHVTIRVEDQALRSLLDEALVDLQETDHGCEGRVEIEVEGRGPWRVDSPEHVATAGSVAAAVGHVLTALNLSAVAATPLLAFHAAVVSRGGNTLVVPARSGMGKSTLTACLLRRGWAYVSDEALALDWPTGALSAYPRPMALSAWSCAAAGGVTGLASLDEVVVRPRDLQAGIDRNPGRVTHVVLLERSQDGSAAVTPAPHRNDGLKELVRRGFTHHLDGGRALQVLADLVRQADVLRLSLGDPLRAADLVTRRICP